MCLNVVSIKDINNYNLLCVPLSKMFAAKKFHQDTVALKKKKKKLFPGIQPHGKSPVAQ